MLALVANSIALRVASISATRLMSRTRPAASMVLTKGHINKRPLVASISAARLMSRTRPAASMVLTRGHINKSHTLPLFSMRDAMLPPVMPR